MDNAQGNRVKMDHETKKLSLAIPKDTDKVWQKQSKKSDNYKEIHKGICCKDLGTLKKSNLQYIFIDFIWNITKDLEQLAILKGLYNCEVWTDAA